MEDYDDVELAVLDPSAVVADDVVVLLLRVEGTEGVQLAKPSQILRAAV